VPYITARNSASETLIVGPTEPGSDVPESTIYAFPAGASTIRGATLGHPSIPGVLALVVDEAGFVEAEAASEGVNDIWAVLLPMLAVRDGKLILASTPGGASGLFHSVFNNEEIGADWARVKATVHDASFFTESMIQSLRDSLGPTSFAVEAECQWSTPGGSIWSSEEIAEILYGSGDGILRPARPVDDPDDQQPPRQVQLWHPGMPEAKSFALAPTDVGTRTPPRTPRAPRTGSLPTFRPLADLEDTDDY
jgi:hypothetical protein